jgi:hypothetical protein
MTKGTVLLQALLVFTFSDSSAFAQSTPNAPRSVEISYTGNLPFFLGFGFVRKKDWNPGGACVQVSVRVTEPPGRCSKPLASVE